MGHFFYSLKPGYAYEITSIILILGFFILIFGSSKQMNTFGVLTALTILFAIATDFLLLPALLLVLKPLQSKAQFVVQES